MCPQLTVLMTVLAPNSVYLRAAIVSILNQSFDDFEFIIIEDTSPCIGAEVIHAVGDPRVRYVLNERRTSLVQQKNQGLRLARGEFIAMMDADDISMPWRLDDQLSMFQNDDDLDVVGSNIDVINADGIITGGRNYPTRHADILRVMSRVVPFCHPSTMIRKSTLLAAGGYQDNGFPIEDYELWSRLAHEGARFANVPSRCLQYRIHDGQVKARRMHDCIRGVLEVKNRYWKRQMGLADLLRMYSEAALLWMPSSAVYSLLIAACYRDPKDRSSTFAGEQEPVEAPEVAGQKRAPHRLRRPVARRL